MYNADISKGFASDSTGVIAASALSQAAQNILDAAAAEAD